MVYSILNFIAVLVSILVALILLALILLAVFPVNIIFSVNSEHQPELRGAMTWLNPLVKGTVTGDTRDTRNILLTVFLFGKKIYTRNLIGNRNKDKKGNYSDKINLLRNIRPSGLKVSASYGFEDPSITGMLCGALDMASGYVDFEVLNNNPDFTPEDNYFDISGEAKINAIRSLRGILNQRRASSATGALHGHR